jgi:hypothetical protein
MHALATKAARIRCESWLPSSTSKTAKKTVTSAAAHTPLPSESNPKVD